MNLRRKKELAAKTFNVGKDRIIFVDARKDDIKEAIAKEDMKQLKDDGAIKIKDPKGRRKVRKSKRRTTGNVRKKVKRRKREYVLLTRKLRKYLKELRRKGEITKEYEKELRRKIRDRDFKSKAQLKEYIKKKMKKVAKRRRREGKTNYSKRIMLLKSERPRIVFRKTNSYIIAQYVESHDAQDKIVFGIDSRELLKHGWPEEAKGSLKSVTASYLTGYLMGLRIKNQNLEEPIVDFGMFKIIYKGRLFAFLRGLIDAGLNTECKEEALPEDERVQGQHLKNKIDFDKIKSSIESVKE